VHEGARNCTLVHISAHLDAACAVVCREELTAEDAKIGRSGLDGTTTVINDNGVIVCSILALTTPSIKIIDEVVG
jgi:hypothetical protein